MNEAVLQGKVPESVYEGARVLRIHVPGVGELALKRGSVDYFLAIPPKHRMAWVDFPGFREFCNIKKGPGCTEIDGGGRNPPHVPSPAQRGCQ